MGARTGREYVEGLDGQKRDVFIQGEHIQEGLSRHPAFRNVVATYAELYDLQYKAELRETMTFEPDDGGARVGMSHLVPRSEDDLVKRRAMMRIWADHSHGFLGRTGDYLNSAVMALGQAGDWFSQADPAFAQNIEAYAARVRNEDLLLTHTLIPPQANRSVSASQQMGGALSARIVKQDDSGIVVSGARLLATIGPIADELLVFPSTVLTSKPEDAPYSFAFAVPCATPGLRFVCRESFDYGRDHFDHPLGSRFEEMDAVVVFDDVHVPFDRCFLLGHPELCNGFYSATSATVHMTHQVVTRTIAKTEFMLGLVSSIARSIGVDRFAHVQENIAEVIVTLETLRAMVRAAEADASPNAFGVMTPKWEPLNAARNWYPKAYQRFPEILRKLGASGLMALPTSADVSGEAGEDIARYLQCATLDGPERVRLFRLAWDAAVSSFAGRQALYEYYFFGDPVRMASALVDSYDREPYFDAVETFLRQR